MVLAIFDAFSAQGASRAFECDSRRSILRHFEFFEKKKSSKNSFWLVLGVTGKSGSQEMSIFEVFEHLKIFENFGKLVKAKENL